MKSSVRQSYARVNKGLEVNKQVAGETVVATYNIICYVDTDPNLPSDNTYKIGIPGTNFVIDAAKTRVGTSKTNHDDQISSSSEEEGEEEQEAQDTSDDENEEEAAEDETSSKKKKKSTKVT